MICLSSLGVGYLMLTCTCSHLQVTNAVSDATNNVVGAA
eukprot:CAMPEP_0206134842 /NCGR_PEP_ID=MMETSP1473-20131121/249_1 /ASSEMBLY_ACC=CAM_ASM_001109 /TAXON_ID=1461547 /ORGANISM="Stichococcus sp, Strain RCC1054" /LENGTH=38 /DNA_ID= /DNA_START= /DNA_END= /DNA_ORIENTATION=